MGSAGHSYDKPLVEAVNVLFKAGFVFCRAPTRSFGAVKNATLERIDWYQNCRLPEPIGNIPPAKAEANSNEARENTNQPAWLGQTDHGQVWSVSAGHLKSLQLLVESPKWVRVRIWFGLKPFSINLDHLTLREITGFNA